VAFTQKKTFFLPHGVYIYKWGSKIVNKVFPGGRNLDPQSMLTELLPVS